ncbi:GNAT family N-acetyltransferase [Arthrobacter sp. Soil763]|uniref:GNAT family N-acetyltransferase n=1 Tax=Arthrobacter sp. Soil763 TaxID=1736402 RepID=UPI000B10611D|nr:GNAT family N-acetyltransferase [Arthrobacter sp. Soil763]
MALTEVTALVLEQLLALAVHDADPDDVTPPLGSAAGWNPERIAWFRAYHRAACGLDGPAREKTWAVTAGGAVAGSVRLRRVPDLSGPGHGVAVETGIWLGRQFRGRGIGVPALLLVKAEAAALGAGLLVRRRQSRCSGPAALRRRRTHPRRPARHRPDHPGLTAASAARPCTTRTDMPIL